MPKRSYTTSGMQGYNPRSSKKARTTFIRRKPASKATYETSRQIARIPRTPFPSNKRVKLTWEPVAFKHTSSASDRLAMQLRLNSPYAPDVSNNWDNGQPMYFANVLAANGPYKTYNVRGWKTKIVVCNISAFPVEVCYAAGSLASSEWDTVTELVKAPDCQRFLLAALGSEGSTVTIYQNANIKKYLPAGFDDSLNCGNYGAGPTNVLYGSLGFKSLDAATSVGIATKLTHEFDMIVTDQDAA